jgi:hypothetical protein
MADILNGCFKSMRFSPYDATNTLRIPSVQLYWLHIFCKYSLCYSKENVRYRQSHERVETQGEMTYFTRNGKLRRRAVWCPVGTGFGVLNSTRDRPPRLLSRESRRFIFLAYEVPTATEIKQRRKITLYNRICVWGGRGGGKRVVQLHRAVEP